MREKYGASGEIRTPMVLPPMDFESTASTSSATEACKMAKKTPSQTVFILNTNMERGQGVKQKIPDAIEGERHPISKNLNPLTKIIAPCSYII